MNENRIKQIMSKVFEVSINKINESTSQDDFYNWDSLHHIEMIIMLENEFNIKISDEDIVNMTKYILIKNIINDKIQNKN